MSVCIDAALGTFRPEFEGAINAQYHAFEEFGARVEAVAEYAQAKNAERFDAIVAEAHGRGGNRQRFDAADGVVFARDLEYIHSRVLEEKWAVPNGMALFSPDTSVPVGARTHTIRRFSEAGQAAIYRAGLQIPRVAISGDEETFPVRHIVNAYDVDMWELASAQYANIGIVERKQRAARNVIVQRLNRLIWYGDEASKLYGVLNYPWLQKFVATTKFDGSAAAQDVLDTLNRALNFPVENSKGVFVPNAMVTTARVRNMLFNKPRTTTTDTTIGKFWTDNNAQIKTVQEAWELEGVGPGGTDGILFYRRDIESINYAMVQPFSSLPAQRQGFVDTVYNYCSYGGVVMPEAGANVLLWVDATP